MSSNKALLAAAIAAFVVAFTGCSRGTSSPDVAGAPDEAADQRQNPMEIAATERLKSMVRVGQPKWANVGTSISVSARVEVDETRVTRVGSPVMGRVNTLRFHEGQEVHRGDVLAQVTSTGLSDGQLQLLKSLSQRQVAQRAVDRAQIMLKADVIGVAELQRREAELAQASAELAAARDQLSLLGMARKNRSASWSAACSLNSVSRVLAPMDGTALERHATLGQMVEPADTMFERPSNVCWWPTCPSRSPATW
ncbi:MAG: efflux RND transporter periplasmic adaptor subunit [Bryobacteraceae bacterium]